MAYRQPLCIVIRLPNVTLPQAELEAALGRCLDRYEPTRDRASTYAQIDIPGDRDQWAAALDYVQALHDPVHRLVQESLIGRPYLDIALTFPPSAGSRSLTIPARLAAAAGEAGMDVEVSVYASETD